MTDPEPNISSTPTLAAVSIKLPPFWPADPDVWFTQIEAQFTMRELLLKSLVLIALSVPSALNLLSKLEISLDHQMKLRMTPLKPNLSNAQLPRSNVSYKNSSVEKNYETVN